jgi:FKBP-type peptidyl-prolyl cis-trans isomerase SlyD
MTIKNKDIVSFHYTLTNDEGEKVESSLERDPMTYLHGANNIIPGLEKAIEGRSVGDEFKVVIQPADAYGEKKEANVQRIPSKRIKNARSLKPGQVLNLQTKQGPVQVTVVKVGRFNIDVDANHPLAGQTLNFDVQITAVRDATEEEIAHGHVHGPEGVEH